MVVMAAVNDGSAAGAGRPLGAAGRIAVAGRGEDHGTTQSAEGGGSGRDRATGRGLAWTPDRRRRERQLNGDGGTRTLNPRVANAVLCQLSYVPERGPCPTSRGRAQTTNRLSPMPNQPRPSPEPPTGSGQATLPRPGPRPQSSHAQPAAAGSEPPTGSIPCPSAAAGSAASNCARQDSNLGPLPYQGSALTN